MINTISQTTTSNNTLFLNENLDIHLFVERNCPLNIHYFLNNGGDINLKNSSGDTLLHTAVKHDNINIAELFLENPNINLDALNEKGETALFHVKSEAMLDLLISHCFDTEVENQNGYFPIHLAASNDYSEVLVALINRYNVSANQKTRDGVTPLHLAAEKNHYATVDLLLQFGADVNAQTHDGLTPLHFAARAGHRDIRTADLLLGRYGNARYNIKTKEGKTALDLALENIRENRLSNREHPINEVGTCILLFQRFNVAKLKKVTSSISFCKSGVVRKKRQGSPLVPLNQKKRRTT
ncbi:MAG: hypothetical protein ChlgKO_09460 [Chlamydiales bacterium]